jgi:hypothetical protein
LTTLRSIALSYHAVIWVIWVKVVSVTSAAASGSVFGEVDFIVANRGLLAIEQKDASA